MRTGASDENVLNIDEDIGSTVRCAKDEQRGVRA
jgi:hypothetical protein